VRIADRRDHLDLGIRVVVDEAHLRGVLGGDVSHVLVDQGERLATRRREVVAPDPAALREVDAAQEAGDHLAELREHEVRIGPRLGERMTAHAQ